MMLGRTQAEIEQHVSTLSASEPNDKIAALNALLIFADNSDHGDLMMQQGVSIPLLAQLDQRENEEQQQLSTRLLIALVESKQHAETIIHTYGTLALITMLESSTCMLKKHLAIKILKYLDDPRVLEPVQMNSLATLIGLLANPSDEIRRSTVRLLDKIIQQHDVVERLNDAGGIIALIRLLEDPSDKIRGSTVELLRKIIQKHDAVTMLNDAGGVSALVGLLEDPCERVSHIALIAILGLLRRPETFDPTIATKATTLLLKRLASEESQKRLRNTMAALGCFIDFEQCLPIFHQKGEVGFFLDLLESENPVIREVSAKILKALLVNTDQSIAMVTAKSLPYFITLLQDQLDHVKGYAAKMVALLMENPDYRNRMIEEAIIPKLIALLSDIAEEEDVISFASQALKRLSEEHTSVISEAGGISALTNLFYHHFGDTDIITILINCVTHDPGTVKELLNNEYVVSSFCSPLRKDEFNEPQQKIMQFFLHLSESQDLEVVWEVGNVTRHLVEMLNNSHPLLKKPILHFFKNLSDKREDLAEEMAQWQTVSILATLLQDPENSVKQLAIAILVNLARTQKAITEFMNTKILTALTAMLDDKDRLYTEGALKIISGLATNSRAIQPLLTEGIVLKITNLLSLNPSDTVREHSMSILACLAEKGQCSTEIIQLYGVVPLMIFLSDTNTSTQSSVARLLECIIRDCPGSHLIMAHAAANLGSVVKTQVDSMIQSDQALPKDGLKRGLFNNPGDDDLRPAKKQACHFMTSSTS